MPIICKYESCKTGASFGYEGKAMFCSKHKEKDMYNVYGRYCIEPNCKIYASYDYIGGNGKYCASHKKENMIDIFVKRCQFQGCIFPAYFDLPKGKGKYCSKHKEKNMIDIKHPKCCVDGCINFPLYNYINKKPEYCNIHKLDNMISRKTIKCSYSNCNKAASFNYPHLTIKYCLEHKDDNMINVKQAKCIVCNNSASYGKPGNKISHCAKHRDIGMIRKPTAKCKKCKNPAIYGSNFIPNHCELHKLDNEQNYLEFPCMSCGLLSILDITNNCEYCNPENFIKARLIKQNNLMMYLDNADLKGTSTDVIIDNGICGKERPDRVYDLGAFILILECDEHQHRDRNYECEITRMINIGQSYGGIPVYFIRWNPDSYIPKDKLKEQDDINIRYNVLKEFINNIINNNYKLPHAFTSVFYMYYDGWSSVENEEWHQLINFE